MNPIVLPDSVDALIDLIDRQFPLKNLPANTDAASMHRMFGGRDIVDWLRSMQRDRDDNALEQLHRHAALNGG
jgi:hypothetical protein